MIKVETKLAGIIIGFFTVCSCWSPSVSLKDVTTTYSSKEYERIFEAWTRHGEVYNFDTLENSLKVSATFLSWEMRQAFVARYAYDYGLDENAKLEMLKKEREEFDKNIVFLVAATATKKQWYEFHRSSNPWRITLITSRGFESIPVRIERIRKPTPMLQAYYGFITIYREVYRFYFEKNDRQTGEPLLNPELSSFSLVFAGALGRVELKWNVKQ